MAISEFAEGFMPSGGSVLIKIEDAERFHRPRALAFRRLTVGGIKGIAMIELQQLSMGYDLDEVRFMPCATSI